MWNTPEWLTETDIPGYIEEHIIKDGNKEVIWKLNQMNGDEMYFNDEGLLHRENGLPAVRNVHNGKQEWWENGKRHRSGGYAAVISPVHGAEYWVDGVRHRDNINGQKMAAVIRPDGLVQYWNNGIMVEEVIPSPKYNDIRKLIQKLSAE